MNFNQFTHSFMNSFPKWKTYKPCDKTLIPNNQTVGVSVKNQDKGTDVAISNPIEGQVFPLITIKNGQSH